MDDIITTNIAVKFENVSKHFNGKFAVKDASFSVRQGSMHALVGENGAGKSTAMNLLFGLHKPSSGSILVKQKKIDLFTPTHSVSLGIGMVHQHFMLSESETALDNAILVFSNALNKKNYAQKILGNLNRAEILKELNHLSISHKMPINFLKKASELSVGEQQKLEIIKLLYLGSDILILDEPTAVLSPQEIEELYHTLKEFCRAGKTVIIITHKLKEVIKHCDYVTVMRKGQVVGNADCKELDYKALSEKMIGKGMAENFRKRSAKKFLLNEAYSPIPGNLQPVIDISDLTLKISGVNRLKNVSLKLMPGEIVGIAGVEGNGQSELMSFLRDPISMARYLPSQNFAKFKLLGKNAFKYSALNVRQMPIGVVPEDRLKQAIIGDFNLIDNFLLGLQFKEGFFTRGISDRRYQKEFARERVREFDVRPADLNIACQSLSGGNQQKLVMARELAFAKRLLLVSHPTRGVDIGATDQIHEQIIECANSGAGILIVSSELDELLALCDRLLVMCNGGVTGEFSIPNQLSSADWEALSMQIGQCMGGINMFEGTAMQ